MARRLMIALHDGGNVVMQADGPEEAIRTLRMAQHPPCWNPFPAGLFACLRTAMRARVFNAFFRNSYN